MNLISQHIQEEQKEFDEKFAGQYGYCNEIIANQIKSFLRSSSLSLVEKIIGEVRGRKGTVVVTEMTLIKNETLESVALLLEQGLEELKDNK